VGGPITADELVYVLDRSLRFVGSGDGWERFARANGGARLLDDSWHGEALASFSGGERRRWRGIYAALLAGQLETHEEDYLCPSPTERRVYHLRVLPQRDDAGAIAYLVHRSVRVDRWALPRTSVQVTRAYRNAVLERPLNPAGFRAASCVEPLGAVGGDLLWHEERPDGTTDVVLADVMGHGLRAARLALALSMRLDGAGARALSVAEEVERLNQGLLADRRALPAFATGLYLRLRPRERLIEIASFAHEGPIFSAAGQVEIASGLPIGVAAEVESWPVTTLALAVLGPRLLVCSDGLPEQFDADGEMFGAARLERAFLDARDAPLEEVPGTLRRTLETFRGAALIKDDVTLLALEEVA
jgi:sigma-B regulation protein RsbU (phosphoserine phosphatase)